MYLKGRWGTESPYLLNQRTDRKYRTYLNNSNVFNNPSKYIQLIAQNKIKRVL